MSFSRIMFVVNPMSGNGRTRKKWISLEKESRQKGWVLEINHTKYPGNATEITRQAIVEGFDCIVAVGGDGTINEVLNGFYHKKGYKINNNVVLSAIPMGTGSDLSRVLGFKDGIAGVNNILKGNKILDCDVIEADYTGWNGKREVRRLINIAAIGLGSKTAMRVNRNSKALGGLFSFLFGTISAIVKYKNPEIRVTVDKKAVFSGKASLLAIANGKYFGGGMMIAPQAEINDGLLDIVLLKGVSKIELLYNLPKVYNGTHLSHPKVSVYQAKEINIHSDDKIYLEMDGELPGYGNASFRVIPGDIRILV